MKPTCVTSCHMLTVNLLEPGDWSSGQVPDSMEHISSMDPIMICAFVTITVFKCVYLTMYTSNNFEQYLLNISNNTHKKQI